MKIDSVEASDSFRTSNSIREAPCAWPESTGSELCAYYRWFLARTGDYRPGLFVKISNKKSLVTLLEFQGTHLANTGPMPASIGSVSPNYTLFHELYGGPVLIWPAKAL